MRHRGLGFVLCVALGLAGCATVQSESVPRDVAAPSSEGLTYFLPKRLVRFTATRTPVDVDKLRKTVDSKRAERDAAEAARKETERARKLAERRLAENDNPALVADLTKARDKAQLEDKVAKKTAEEAETAFQEATDALRVAEIGRASCTYSAKLELLAPQADTTRRYVARLHRNILRDDTLALKVTPAGLLSSGNVVAADRTGDIIVELAGALAGLSGSPTKFETSMIGEEPAAPVCASLPRQFVEIFDPVAPGGLSGVNDRLIGAQFPFQLQIDEAPSTPASAAAWEAFAEDRRSARLGAIYYRSAAPRVITIRQAVTMDPVRRCSAVSAARIAAEEAVAKAEKEKASAPEREAAPIAAKLEVLRALLRDAEASRDACVRADSWQPVDAAIVMLPQAGPVSYIPMESSAFVRTVDDVQFADGSIASWNSERPSEAMEVVRLPVKVLTAIVSVPAQLLSLRVDYSTKAQSLADMQRQQIEMENRLRLLRACLAQAEAAGESGQSCLP